MHVNIFAKIKLLKLDIRRRC